MKKISQNHKINFFSLIFNLNDINNYISSILYAYKDFISLTNRFIIFILLCYLYEFFASNQRLYRDAENNIHTVHCTCCSSERRVYMRAICRTCSRLIVWRRVWRNQYLSTIWYDFDKHFYILRRKSTHIYDKMYNSMTLKKKKKKFRSGGFLRSVGRGQSNNLFFLALSRVKE